MPFAAALSSHPVTALAAGEVIGQLLDAGGRYADLVVLATTPGHAGALEDVAAAIDRLLAPSVLIGTSAPAVGIPGTYVAEGPAVAAWSATCGPARLRELEAAGEGPTGTASPPAATVMLATSVTGVPLAGLGGTAPVAGAVTAAPLVAGRADRVVITRAAGAVLVDLATAVDVRGALGLRQIGSPLEVDAADGHLVLRLGGAAARDALVDLARDGVAAADLPRVGEGLHVEPVGPDGGPTGDPLRVLGTRPADGALALARAVPVGSTLRVLVRDPVSAARALRLGWPPVPPAGALVIGGPGHGRVLLGDERASRTALSALTDDALPPATLYVEAPTQLLARGGRMVAHTEASVVVSFPGPAR